METKELEELVKIQTESEKNGDDVRLMSEVAKELAENRDFHRYNTGFETFDSVAKLISTDKGGLALGDLVIVAAPTGNGKTTFCQTLTQNMLEKEGMLSLWFTYEVSVWHLWEKFKSMGAKDDQYTFVPAKHTTGSVDWILGKIKEAKVKYPTISIVVIDHLGFLAPSQKMNQNMNTNYSSYLGQIVRDLKKLAIDEEVVIILPVHMNKGASDDPALSDIGNSSGIAQEADFVFLMARENDKENGNNFYTDYTKVKLAKNRESGETRIFWIKKEEGRLKETHYEPKKSQESKIYR